MIKAPIIIRNPAKHISCNTFQPPLFQRLSPH